MLFFNWFMPDEGAQPDWVSDAKSKPLLDAVGGRLMASLPEDPEKQILEQFQNPLREDGSGDPVEPTGSADTPADPGQAADPIGEAVDAAGEGQ
jgi:membrane protein required for colicin V production